MNTITPQIFVAQKTEAPTLTVRTNALNTLAIIFAQGGELKAHEYPEISTMLAYNNGGFFDPKYDITE